MLLLYVILVDPHPYSLMARSEAHITCYQRWLLEQRGLAFDSYDALWRWSTTSA